MTKRYFDHAKRFGLRFGWHPIKHTIKFLDKINGLLTALATIAIAALTIVVARDANKQDAASNGQLSIMRGQLGEMKSSSVQTDKLIAASTAQAQATADSVSAFINSQRGQLFINSITLNEKSVSDTSPTIGFSFINLGHSPVVVYDALIQCQFTKYFPVAPVYDVSKEIIGQFTLGTGSATQNNGGTGSYPVCALPSPMTAEDWSNVALFTGIILFSGYIRYYDDFHHYTLFFADIYNPKVHGFGFGKGMPAIYNRESQDN